MLEDRIYTFNKYLKEIYGKRVARISFDLNIPCPWAKCVFCNHSSFVPFDCVHITLPGWEAEFEKIKNYMKKRYVTETFIAYFQNNTSTFGEPAELGRIYKKAVELDDIRGLIISTRPDYITRKIVEEIKNAAEKVEDCWIELGLQSVHDSSLEFLKRGHDSSQYFQAVKIIEEFGDGKIKVAPHVILGIPGENLEMYKETLRKALSSSIVRGVKFHHLQIHKDTELFEKYSKTRFDLLSADSYIEIVAELLQYIDPKTVIFRLFTTTPGDYLVAPRWNMKTQQMLEKLNNYMELNNLLQGGLYDINK